MVSFYKYAYFGSSRLLDPKSIAHACRHVCKMKKWHAFSQGNIISIIDMLGKVKQVMHNVNPGLYFTHCLGLRPDPLLALRTSLGATSILAKL